MITEVVNGSLLQVFDFSTPDVRAKFYAPVRIGAGYREMVARKKAVAAISSPKYVTMAVDLLRSTKKPNGMSDGDWRSEIELRLQQKIMRDAEQNGLETGDVNERLIILESLLAPSDNSIAVEEWYMNYAMESEAEQVVNFFNGLVPAKIETDPIQADSGQASAPAPKAVRSRNTSRRRSNG